MAGPPLRVLLDTPSGRLVSLVVTSLSPQFDLMTFPERLLPPWDAFLLSDRGRPWIARRGNLHVVEDPLNARDIQTSGAVVGLATSADGSIWTFEREPARARKWSN